jgi:lipoate---protein ligase
VTSPTLVLGSTQSSELVDRGAVRTTGVQVVQRRGGGGAVYLEPGDPLWLDAWIPHDDPLWEQDVSAAAAWVGAWWVEALEGIGLEGLHVHTGRAAPGDLGELVCFAGRGPGEVFHHGQKVVGLSQWRAREGALFSSCAYLRWDPSSMLELLDVDDETRAEISLALNPVATGLAALDPSLDRFDRLAAGLTATFPSFTMVRDGAGNVGRSDSGPV